MEVDKSLMLDTSGRPITQSLFLEIGYSDMAIYTLKDEDHVYKGKLYPSIKKLYLKMEDPTEYKFASTYLLGWSHWKRIGENKALRRFIDEWREELELQLRSKAVGAMIESAREGNYQAAKWLADKGWDVRPAGRPSKAEVEKERKIAARIDDEFKADVVRLYGSV